MEFSLNLLKRIWPGRGRPPAARIAWALQAHHSTRRVRAQKNYIISSLHEATRMPLERRPGCVLHLGHANAAIAKSQVCGLQPYI